MNKKKEKIRAYLEEINLTNLDWENEVVNNTTYICISS